MGRHADGLALAIPIPARPELDEVAMPRRNGEALSDKDISTLRRMFRAVNKNRDIGFFLHHRSQTSPFIGTRQGDAK